MGVLVTIIIAPTCSSVKGRAKGICTARRLLESAYFIPQARIIQLKIRDSGLIRDEVGKRIVQFFASNWLIQLAKNSLDLVLVV